MNKTFDCDFSLKSISDSGTFSGYGSVFHVKDSYDEIVVPGAFTASLAAQKSAGRMPAMLWQHRSSEPLGVYTSMEEDAVGLRVEGQLALSTVRGAEAHALLKMGAISGLSIGFIPREDSFDRVTGIKTLKRVDLMEISLVTFPANDAARVSGIKSIEAFEDLSAAECYLRDAGFSRREAVAFIARIKKLQLRDAADHEMKRLLETIQSRVSPV